MTWELSQGDCLDVLKTLPDKKYHCCVTSPPYYSLRDYDCKGQIGLEATPEEYIDKLVQVFGEVKRTLRDDGTLWLNIGDTYSTTKANSGLKTKNLIGIPWRLALALQADGWYLRSDIIWHKPNPTPEPVKDRPTASHEYIFLLSKQDRYYYDGEAIKEDSVDPIRTAKRYEYEFSGSPGILMPDGGQEKAPEGKRVFNVKRNKRSIWKISTKPYKEAHFATFPPELPLTCLLAGTSEIGCCPICGSPWVRLVERTEVEGGRVKLFSKTGDERFRSDIGREVKETTTKTIGWEPTCDCGATTTVPCVALDPFAGAGTTLFVAEQLGLDSTGIELNPDYCELIYNRMATLERSLFAL